MVKSSKIESCDPLAVAIANALSRPKRSANIYRMPQVNMKLLLSFVAVITICLASMGSSPVRMIMRLPKPGRVAARKGVDLYSRSSQRGAREQYQPQPQT